MRVCCVDGCSASRKCGVELKYFKFPKSKTVRKAWLKVVKSGVKLTSNTLVCSSHFQESDYTTVNGRRTLKKTSVPSLSIDNGDPKPNDTNSKRADSKHEEESDSDESNSGKDTPRMPNDTEVGVANNKGLMEILISTDSDLASEQNDTIRACEKIDTIISDVLMKEFSSDIGRNNAKDSLDRCESVVSNNLAKVTVEDNGLTNEKDGASRRNSVSDPTQADSNGCDPSTDPLSCLNGDLESSNAPTPSDPTPDAHKPTPGSEKPTIDLERTPPDSEKPILDPDRILTDIEKLLDSENPPAVIENPTADVAKILEPERTVLDPKTGLMRSDRRDSIESIQDSCESLGESTEEGLRLAEPVFVEISVDPSNIGTPSPPESPTDCMMIVENVQVDIDPAALLMMDDDGGDGRPATVEDDDDDDVQVLEKKPEDPVSLLTSSDEDDVILQEPHIDCVSVSDETDEDDQPLTRLLRDARKKKAQVKKVTDILERRLNDIFWGKSNEFYCYMCSFSTKSKSSLATHARKHTAPGQKPPSLSFNVCNVCSFQTPSKSQFVRHKRKHREDKKFQCHMCDYRARHKMSLVYHVKATHLSAMDVDPDPETPDASRRSSKSRSKKRTPRRAKKDDDDYVPGADV